LRDLVATVRSCQEAKGVSAAGEELPSNPPTNGEVITDHTVPCHDSRQSKRAAERGPFS
jgi:hypothetical protein